MKPFPDFSDLTAWTQKIADQHAKNAVSPAYRYAIDKKLPIGPQNFERLSQYHADTLENLIYLTEYRADLALSFAFFVTHGIIFGSDIYHADRPYMIAKAKAFAYSVDDRLAEIDRAAEQHLDAERQIGERI